MVWRGICLLFGGKLFQQYVVDCWAATEQQCLCWLELNQKTIRAELYSGVVDALAQQDNTGENLGQQFVLPASFSGGPQNTGQNYQDSMALVQILGNAHLFITMTANPN